MKDGFLLINKPAGFTSFDVIAKLRGILKTKKIGHGGTLDPNVTGVLPVFVGRATKAIDMLERQEKKYTATLKLGIATDTQDIWGKEIATAEPERDVEKIRETMLSFKGEQIQLPPMYSAIKINGVRLYDLAREGINVPRDSRKITVFDIDFLGKTENEDEYSFSVYCSKGTYVRTLCADMGAALKCGATMTSLVRTQALGFDLSECITLDEVQKAADEGRADALIRPIDELFSDLPPIFLTEKQTKHFKNGLGLEPQRVSGVIYDTAYEIADWQKYSVYSNEGVFLGIGKVEYPKREFKCQKLFNIED
ncbi:MAG: tRNA pseudouridine(55) synthase TruB [Oscillospiraceae bacterium]|nr:tRNA pseudouridine(55) synthase TruB [Oscillospiraceae bacterium]